MLLAAVLVAALHLAVPLQYASAEPKQPVVATCEPGKETKTTTMATYGIVEITCPDNTVMQPALKENKEGTVFSCDKEAKEAPVGTLVPGATLAKKEDAGQKVVLAVPQLPAEKRSVFFQCKGNGNQANGKNSCYIEVAIPGSPESGPNACVVPDSEIVFRAPNASTVVQFSCAANSLTQQPGKVLDENCKDELDLVSVVQGAVFKPGEQANGLIQVSFPEPPAEQKKLCFTCKTTVNDKPCKVLIVVAGADPSAAVGITARTALAVGVVIVAAGLLDKVKGAHYRFDWLNDQPHGKLMTAPAQGAGRTTST